MLLPTLSSRFSSSSPFFTSLLSLSLSPRSYGRSRWSKSDEGRPHRLSCPRRDPKRNAGGGLERGTCIFYFRGLTFSTYDRRNTHQLQPLINNGFSSFFSSDPYVHGEDREDFLISRTAWGPEIRKRIRKRSGLLAEKDVTSTERGHLSLTLNLPLLLFEFLFFLFVHEEKRKVDPGGRGKLSSIDRRRTQFFLLLIVAFKFLPHFESIKSIRREGSLQVAYLFWPVTERRGTDRKRARSFLLLNCTYL